MPLQIETGKCPDLDALSDAYYRANVEQDWNQVRNIGNQISAHIRYCPTCNAHGLVNQLFSDRRVTVVSNE